MMLERPMASPLRFLSWLFVNFWGKELFYFLVPMFPLCKYSKCVFWTWTRRCSNPNHFDHQKGESSKCKEFKCKENIFKCKEKEVSSDWVKNPLVYENLFLGEHFPAISGGPWFTYYDMKSSEKINSSAN